MIDPLQFVPKYYQMDPSEEDVLFGSELRDGMVVLCENDSDRRVLPDDYLEPGVIENLPVGIKKSLLTMSRWCTISKFRTKDDDLYAFIGVYEDGLKCVQSSNANTGWYVKRYSIPTDEMEFVAEVDSEWPIKPLPEATDDGLERWAEVDSDSSVTSNAALIGGINIEFTKEPGRLGVLDFETNSIRSIGAYEV